VSLFWERLARQVPAGILNRPHNGWSAPPHSRCRGRPKAAEQLADSLATDGYQVDLAADGNTALGCGRSTDYVVMTIDRMLPGLDLNNRD
jgi:hypothetical protein